MDCCYLQRQHVVLCEFQKANIMGEHCFIVSYDLCQPNRDYESLYEALKSFPNWGRLTESTWAVISNKSCVDIRDYLMQFVDNDDRLIVVLGGKSAAWVRVMADNNWVKENLAK